MHRKFLSLRGAQVATATRNVTGAQAGVAPAAASEGAGVGEVGVVVKS